MRTPQDIIKEIRGLLSELEHVSTSSQSKVSPAVRSAAKKKEKDYSGCMGGIVYLVDNGFFTSPKDRAEVIEKLKKEGWHYAPNLVSMNLLSLTRQRTLTRLKGDKTRSWKYVIRK